MEDVLAIRDEYRLQEWSQIIQAGQNSGLSILNILDSGFSIAMFCWLCPVLAIVYGFTGKFFWKTGEKSSQKIYQLSTLMEAS